MQQIIPAETIAKRLQRLHGRVTASEHAAGIAWYYRAADEIAAIAAEYGVPAETVARIVAVLSPSNRWASNVAATRACLAEHAAGNAPETMFGRVGTYNVNVSKAWRIADGDYAALSGPKVEAFAANLMGDLDFVTLDTWAVRAAMGWTRGTGQSTPGSKRQRAETVHGYRLAARRCGMAPAEFQAVLWVHVRGEAG